MREGWENHWKDYYRILQVDSSAEQEIIRDAYDRLARKYHPDVSRDPLADSRMRDFNEAFEILGNSEKRARYHSEWDRRNARTTPARDTPEAATAHPQSARNQRPSSSPNWLKWAVPFVLIAVAALIFSTRMNDTRNSRAAIQDSTPVSITASPAAKPSATTGPIAYPTETQKRMTTAVAPTTPAATSSLPPAQAVATVLPGQSGQTNVSVTPTFSWPEQPQATVYQIQVSDDPTFKIISILSTTGGRSFAANTKLAYGMTYYWRVFVWAPNRGTSPIVSGTFVTESRPR
jgi:hypothetical protein